MFPESLLIEAAGASIRNSAGTCAHCHHSNINLQKDNKMESHERNNNTGQSGKGSVLVMVHSNQLAAGRSPIVREGSLLLLEAVAP